MLRHTKNGSNERTDQSSRKKVQLRDEDIANISDAQFKTLVIRMLTEMVENGRKIEEEVKAMKSEIKDNVQGTSSEGKETRAQINGLYQEEEINSHQGRMKKQEFKKMRRGLGTSGTTLNILTSES